jgi:hypothetical protein
MSLPLITSQQITDYLLSKKLGIEVFDEFPQDKTQARYGVYVNDPAGGVRTPYSLAVRYGGNIYVVEDQMRIIYVTFQGDKKRDAMVDAIQSIVENNTLLDGYHERDFTMSQEYVNRAEYRTYDFILKRLEFQ